LIISWLNSVMPSALIDSASYACIIGDIYCIGIRVIPQERGLSYPRIRTLNVYFQEHLPFSRN